MEKTFKSRLEKLESDVWHFCIPVEKDIAELFIHGDNRRVICTINHGHTYPAALMHDGQGAYLININKEVRKKMGVTEGIPIEVHLKKDTSDYGMPMPEEFQELLDQDEEGNRVFHSLTLGKQRSLLYIAGKLKSAEKRLEKSIIIIDYLKSVNGILDFKELNEAIKNSKFKKKQ